MKASSSSRVGTRPLAIGARAWRSLAFGLGLGRLLLGGAAAAGRLGFGEQRHGAVHADLQHALVGRNRFVLGAVLDVGTEAADAGQHRLAILRMEPDLAW